MSGFSQASHKEASQKPPNIILINADDLGYGDVGCYGATMVQTPNIDRLAREGRRFTDAHTASAVCSPSRYGLMTGQYPLRRNFWGPIPGVTEGLTIDKDSQTLASTLKKSGYATACVGKWHLGFGEEAPNWNGELTPGPLELGFDYYFGIPTVNSGPPFVYVENHHVVGYDPQDPFVMKTEAATQKWPAKSGYNQIGGAQKAHLLYEDEKVGTTLKNKAVAWMESRAQKQDDRPFFLYLATTNIHHPFTPAPQFKGTSQAGRYGGFIHELDWIVGEIVKTVEAMGEEENTLVIFTSDNGGMLNHGGQDAWKAGHRLNGDLLGFKFGAWEGGHRVPFIAKWPGKVPANSTSDHLLSQVDLLATFAAITNQPLNEEEEHDSIDQLAELTGEADTPQREMLVISPNSPEHLVIRKGDWVYIPAQDAGGFQGKKVGDHTLGGAAAFALTGQKNSDVSGHKIRTDAPKDQLYNLKEDLSQTENVVMENPAISNELRQLLATYRNMIGPYPKLGWINIDAVAAREKRQQEAQKP
ncbi:arylsulfatase [Echinicola strongylocentroti]|uniref:Arylsulfatase n=2 Tax=Echinicola strongylocentroti TaxID=1795355 RepID=A0A2Z4IPS7_9BACT|nr:arylsulfatase [Echinicola strongylocentroti]